MIIVKVVALRRTLTGVAVVYIQLDVVVGREMQARRLRELIEREVAGEGYMQIFESVRVRILNLFALAVKDVERREVRELGECDELAAEFVIHWQFPFKVTIPVRMKRKSERDIDIVVE